MACILDSELVQLRQNEEFNEWLTKIKDQYPTKSDEEVEKTLITFMELNNGNFPGYTPFGTRSNPQESETFAQIAEAYGGDEVRAMEFYELLFDKSFIDDFGNWCGVMVNTDGLTPEQIQEDEKKREEKLLRAVRNPAGEPTVFFVNSVDQLCSPSTIGATTNKDRNLPFKVTAENGEFKVISGFDRPVQSGSITFVVAKDIVDPISSDDNVYIDTSEIDKTYDINSTTNGFTDKRLRLFLTQSSEDAVFISRRISTINGILKHAENINSREEAIAFIKNRAKDFVFDTDTDSPFGCIQLTEITYGRRKVWQITSPIGIFCTNNRFNITNPYSTVKEGTQTNADKIANRFFIGKDDNSFKKIIDYIISNVSVVKPDSYLVSPIVDYDGNEFILKPASIRTQHNVKTEFGLTYAVYMYNKDSEKFNKYLNWAKQFPEIRQNSAGAGVINNVNMVGNLIGFILSGQLIDSNYYTAHSYDQNAVEQAIFVSRHQNAVRSIVKELWKDVQKDVKSIPMIFLGQKIGFLAEDYEKMDFSNIADNIYKNRTIRKLDDDALSHSFCDTIDKAKSLYTYRRNDSGSKKMYDATEYTKVVSTYELLNSLNKDIKESLLNKSGLSETVSGESLEKLINRYLTSIDTIVGIMDDDISKLEDFIWHTPLIYTPEYYSQLLYFDRSVLGMYTNSENKTIIENLFSLDSELSDSIQQAIYKIFNQQQIRRFENLRDRYYKNYVKLTNKRSVNEKTGSLQQIIDEMIRDAISHIVDDWCNKNLKCLTEAEEKEYRENLKLDLEGHIKAGYPIDIAIGGSASSSHGIINVLYRIIQTQGKRSNLLIKQKGDMLIEQFKSVFDNHSPFNQCRQFCETITGKNKVGLTVSKTTGYFIRDVNYGQYYRAKVAAQREILNRLPKNEDGKPLYYTIDESKSTATKLIIEWKIGSEKYESKFLDDLDDWIEANANRRYKASYYKERRRILGQERDGIIVGNEAANRQNMLRRQIDGIKNRYRDRKTGVFIPSRVHPVQRKILENLEQQLSNLASPYETYTNSDGVLSIREKTGLDLAIALNIQDWNKYIANHRNYVQNTELYKEKERELFKRIEKDITKEEYDSFVSYYHKKQATQEYYDTLEKIYGGSYGKYQEKIDDIRFRRRSILSRVKHGKKQLFQQPNLDELTESEWEELKRLDIEENKIREKISNHTEVENSVSARFQVINEATGKPFIDEHIKSGKLHQYIDSDGEYRALSVYYITGPSNKSLIEEVLVDMFSTEEGDFINDAFDPTNSSYEQPKAYDDSGNKLYKNDKYDEIKNNPKLFKLYETFLDIMQEANQMFGYAAISSNYKLPQIYEREASILLGRGCYGMDPFIYKMKRQFVIDDRDLDVSYTSDIHADNSTSGKLRKRFVEMLKDPEHISTDLVYSVMAYYMTACRYSDKQDVQAQCELINRRILGSATADKILKEQSKNTIETFLFENTVNSSGPTNAMLSKFMTHTTATMLKWKLKTALKAFADGYRLLTNLALSNKWNMRGHFWKATSTAVRQSFSSIKSSVGMLDYDLSEALMSLNHVNFSSFADTNKTKFTRAYNRSGMMTALTFIDHVTTKSIMLCLYDSIRLYTNPDGTKQFLNIDEFVEVYSRQQRQKLGEKFNKKVAKKEAEKLFWNTKETLIDAYQLGMRDKDGKIEKGTEHVLNIKEEYQNMFSEDPEVNKEQWAILQTRVEGQLDMMEAAVNGRKAEDSKSSAVSRTWYLKPIFQIRTFLISGLTETFLRHSDMLKHMQPSDKTSNTTTYKSSSQYDLTNKTASKINKFWDSDNAILKIIDRISSEREMYNTLTGTKDVNYFFGIMSTIRKSLEDLIIYFGNLHNGEKGGYQNVTKAEQAAVVNFFLVCMESFMLYNMAMFIGGLICCLCGQGSAPDDEDEWFPHWILWTLYDFAGSMLNDTLVYLPTGDTIFDIFRQIMAMIPTIQQVKNSLLRSGATSSYVEALYGDDEMFENAEYGSNRSPFNLIKSGKWQGEMYGKRYFYEAIQTYPVLAFPWYLSPITIPASMFLPEIPLANVKESFSSTAARAKSSFTFNNLSPADYLDLKTPSSSMESYEKFHDYGWGSPIAKGLYSLIGGQEGEQDIVNNLRDISNNPDIPVPNMSPVDKVERMIPLGRKYN